jgi:hypothetical protein
MRHCFFGCESILLHVSKCILTVKKYLPDDRIATTYPKSQWHRY